jgi:carbonic anhydrase/acetyltransferase-like protein (isoleucine patch superfamily)
MKVLSTEDPYTSRKDISSLRRNDCLQYTVRRLQWGRVPVLYPFLGQMPQVAQTVFIAPGARVIGQVTMASSSSVWYNTVVRGDSNTIVIGEGSNIQDNSVLHVDEGEAKLTIGRDVTVGHTCILHGCSIGDNVLVGMGSTILNGAVIGDNCLIGAGSLITEGKQFPPGSVIMGRPAKVVREVGEKELEMIRFGAAHYRENARNHRESLTAANRA